jgi:hypothetical protein
VLGLILVIAARNFVVDTISQMRSQPGRSVLVGLAVLVVFPILAVALIVTIIGMPVGLLAFMAYPLLLFVGSVLGALGLAI